MKMILKPFKRISRLWRLNSNKQFGANIILGIIFRLSFDVNDMEDAKLKNKGLLIQLLGVAILIGGLHGFGIVSGLPHFIVIGICLVVFSICLSKGGELVRKSKK